MVYYFRLSEQEKRIQKLLLEGADLGKETIYLYPESPRILNDIKSNPISDFFPVEKRTLAGAKDDFETIMEAIQAYIDGEADTINAVVYGI